MENYNSYFYLVFVLLFACVSIMFSAVSMFLNTRKWRSFERTIDHSDKFQILMNDHIFISKDVTLIVKVLSIILAEIFLFVFALYNGWSVFQICIYVICLLCVLIIFDLICMIVALRQNLWGYDGKRIPKWLMKSLLFINQIYKKLMPQTIKEFKTERTTIDLYKKNKYDRKEIMLKGILQFAGETVKDIMTSRLDIQDLDVKTPFSKVIKLVSEDSYSRIPVYSESRDNIIGILYVKDLLPYLKKSDKFHWSFLIRPHLCVPETKKIDNLLREFQSRKIHIAVVIDEYGGVSGLVTLEDIIEEIVGEINDEHDEDKNQYVSLGTNAYVFDAKTSLQNFCKLFNLESSFFDDVEGNSDTLAGLLLDIIDDFPQKYQIVKFQQFRFEILAVDERHIQKVKVSIIKEEE